MDRFNSCWYWYFWILTDKICPWWGYYYWWFIKMIDQRKVVGFLFMSNQCFELVWSSLNNKQLDLLVLTAIIAKGICITMVGRYRPDFWHCSPWENLEIFAILWTLHSLLTLLFVHQNSLKRPLDLKQISTNVRFLEWMFSATICGGVTFVLPLLSGTPKFLKQNHAWFIGEI